MGRLGAWDGWAWSWTGSQRAFGTMVVPLGVSVKSGEVYLDLTPNPRKLDQHTDMFVMDIALNIFLTHFHDA